MLHLCLRALLLAAVIAATEEAAAQDPWRAQVTDRLDLLESKIDRLVLSVEHLADRIGSSGPVGQKLSKQEPAPSAGYAARRQSESEKPQEFDLSALATILFVHEVWVFMQHANVLMNPYLQRLDRNYGIALLRKRLYWVIAGVLGAYWAREVGSLLLCYSYVSPTTQTMILLSSAYHVGKIALISLDAVRKFSPKLGIMSLVIDNWHLDSVADVLITVKRVVLQGFDTMVHLSIVCDMCLARPELWRMFGYIAAVWSFHTIACQVTKKSTATLFVEAFKHVIYGHVAVSGAEKRKTEDEEDARDIFFSPEHASKTSALSEQEEHQQVVMVSGGAGVLLFVSFIATAMGSMSWFSLCVVGSLSAAVLVSVFESIRCRKAGTETKEMVRYLLSRDKPCGEGGGGGVPSLRKVGHYAGWSAPHDQMAVPEVAFLAHPTTLSCAFALWAKEEQGQGQKWEERGWMRLFAPLIWLYSLFWMYVSPLVCDPFLYMDHFCYHGHSSQVWLSRLFGWQFIAFPSAAHRNICATLIEADRRGVKVLGLGALNKAEFVNKSGASLLAEVQPRHTRLVHGNTLTAAVVAANVLRLLAQDDALPTHAAHASEREREDKTEARPRRQQVLLTGPTSKVGRGVALKLLEAGVDVVCQTSSALRFQALEQESIRLGLLRQEHDPHTHHRGLLSLATTLEEGVHCSLWVVGKFDLQVRHHLPRGATAVVFAVPCPLTLGGSHRSARADVRVVDGGLLRLDMSHCTPRSFPILLPSDTVYACHAAALVHAHKGWMHHEVGEVSFPELLSVMQAATELGFRLPDLPPPNRHAIPPPHIAPGKGGEEGKERREVVEVVVVGAGASGLAAAACIQERGLGPVVVLERRGRIEGHWGSQYDDLSITSRREHCSLPRYKMLPPGSFPHNLSAADFIRYLTQYAARFSLDVRLNQEVASARRVQSYASSGSSGRWIVSLADGSVLEAAHLVVASGLHARPVLPPSADAFRPSFHGQILHSSQVRGLEQLAMQQVVLVGMGNSAVDVAMALLDRGAPQVTMSVRSRPPVFRRQWGPLSVEVVSKAALQHLPALLGDVAGDLFTSLLYGPGWWKGHFPSGLKSWSPYQARRVPVIDKWAGSRKGGGFVDMIKSGRIRVVGPLVEARGGEVVAECDGGQCAVPCDVLVYATGFEATYHDWLQSTEEGAGEGSLHMVGFEHGKALLPLHHISLQAEQLGERLAAVAQHTPMPTRKEAKVEWP